MAGKWWTFDHTADIGLAAEADTLAELYAALAEGLAEVICPIVQVAPAETRELSVEAEDAEALAVDFLSEVMVTMQTDLFVISSVEVSRADENSLAASLAGQPYDPARHEFGMEVKAVTYHQLKIANEDGKWTGRLILDI